MRGCLGIGLCVLAVVVATHASAAPPPRGDLPIEGVIANPDWIKKPDGDDVSRFYPPFAVFLGLSGRARITCVVTDVGVLADCAILTETPAGFGFGEAGKQMAAIFRMKPMTVDGAPVSGARVNIPLNFRPPAESIDPAPANTTAEPSPRALTLARRIVSATSFDADINARIKAAIQRSREAYAAQGATREEQIALDQLEQAQVASVPMRMEHSARFYAGSISEPDMAKIAAFMESAAGKVWIAQVDKIQAIDEAEQEHLQAAITKDAKARLCRQITCLPADTAAPAIAAK